jgi:acyl-CoA-binding protein
MPDTSPDFDAAVLASKQLPGRPDNASLLKLYALFKQSTEGDAPEDGPSDMVGRFKHKAWAELRGTAAAEAQQRYIDLVADLQDSMA